jgi:hypothetical protein
MPFVRNPGIYRAGKDNHMLSRINSFFTPVKITLITLFISLFFMTTYVTGFLRNNINFHVLNADQFGVPTALADKGIVPFFYGSDTGWDGQFYYFMSNDLVGKAINRKHFDAPAYRYQRIGLPLTAKIVSLATFQSWVTPLSYYLTYLGLILVATYLWASFLKEHLFSPAIALIWSLCLGVQLTLINALPDAAADSFAIIALVCYFRNQFMWYVLAMSFAVLSREAYLLLPLGMGLASLILWLKDPLKSAQKFITLAAINGIPVFVFAVWQAYIRLHFHHAPASQMKGIFANVFEKYIQYFFHPLHGRRESVLIFIFTTLLLIALYLLATILIVKNERRQPQLFKLAFVFLPMCLLYTKFGHTVMFDYTGYMKTASILFFIIPFVYVMRNEKMPRLLTIFLSILTVSLLIYFFQDRVYLAPNFNVYGTYKYKVKHNALPYLACVTKPRVELTLKNTQPFYKYDAIRHWRGYPYAEFYTVTIKNIGKQDLPVVKGSGAIRLSSQWVDNNGNVISEGPRSYIQETIRRQQSITTPTVVVFPSGNQYAVLWLSLVQEGCQWFYKIDPKNGIRIQRIVSS